MVMIKLVQKEGVKNVKNYFMFLKLVNIVLNVLGNCQNSTDSNFCSCNNFDRHLFSDGKKRRENY